MSSRTIKNKVVTAASDQYFHSLLTLIQTLLESNKTIALTLEIWDIGLTSRQRQFLKLIEGKHICVRDLSEASIEPFPGAFLGSKHNYAWKAFCVVNSLQNSKNIIWIDAGIAVTADLSLFFEKIEVEGYIFFDNFDRTNLEWTSDECKEFMHFGPNDEEGLQISAGVFGVSNSSSTLDLILEWVKLCSHEETMKSDDPKHRHDQSVLSILSFRKGIHLTGYSDFCLEGHDASLARAENKLFLAHRRTFSWYDLNFLINLNEVKPAGSPVLTIVTTTFNDAEGFQKTANSIPISNDIEWIVVDGGSESKTLELIEPLVEARSGTLLYGPDSGIFHGMNKGLLHARGRYVQFLNGGDCLDKNLVMEDMLNEILNSNTGWWTGSAVGVNEDNEVLWNWPIPNILKLRLGINSYCHQATVVSRLDLIKLKGFREDSIYSDWALSLVLRKRLGRPQQLRTLKVKFLTGGVSGNQTIEFWVRESSRLRVLYGLAICKSEFLDLMIQRAVGQLIRSRRGQLIRPDLT
jgi:hypothetical protein